MCGRLVSRTALSMEMALQELWHNSGRPVSTVQYSTVLYTPPSKTSCPLRVGRDSVEQGRKWAANQTSVRPFWGEISAKATEACMHLGKRHGKFVRTESALLSVCSERAALMSQLQKVQCSAVPRRFLITCQSPWPCQRGRQLESELH